jgi:ketosteroid isomerase-like protein
MLDLTTRAISAWLLLAVLASFALANPVVSGKDGGPSSVFAYSSDLQVATFQRQAKRVVERYQDGLNTSDFPVIRTLFAANAVAEWNEKATVVGVDAMAGPYEELFKTTKFTTDFQFDAVDLHGDIAIVRTHHPIGQTELSLKDGSKKLDMNREIFVLKRFGSD